MCKVLRINKVQFGVLGVVGMYIFTQHSFPGFLLILVKYEVDGLLASSGG
jgi:hypothetical protein